MVGWMGRWVDGWLDGVQGMGSDRMVGENDIEIWGTMQYTAVRCKKIIK